MLTLVNKLATAVFIRADEQYSCQIKSVDSETEDLIQVLSLQVITQLKIRLIADNLELYRKTSSLNQRTEFLSFFINLETESSDFFISFETVFSDISVKEKSILNLIKDIQEFDLLCKQISSQFHRKLKRNSSFALIRNEILRKMNHVFVS